MAIVPPELASWADLLAKVGQFLLGLCTLVLALFAATVKRRDLFRTELDKKRLEELGRVRTSLQSLLFDLYYIPSISDSMNVRGWNLDELKANDPDSWEQYRRYKDNGLELFYKFSDAEYYLFPEWISSEKRKNFAQSMHAFAPFTLVATSSKSQKQREQFAVAIAEMKKHFDEALRAYA